MSDNWYYSCSGQKAGPVSGSQLKQLAANGQLLPDDLIWKEGLSSWCPAQSAKALQFAKFGPAQAGSPPPLPLSSSKPKCPTCGGEEAKLLSFIHHLHQEEVRVTSESGGVEVSLNNLKGLASSGHSEIVTQRGLSKLAAPPDGGAPCCALATLGILGGAIYVVVTATVGLSIGIPLIVFGVACIVGTVFMAIDEEKEKETWEKTFLCLGCGTKFIPPSC